MSFKKLTAMSVAALVTVALAAPVMAEGEMLSGADAIAKRQELMKENGMTLRGGMQGQFEGDARVAAAQTMVDNFAMLGALFPEDSQTGDTKALPEIWTDQEGFMEAYSAAVVASANLLTAANTGDDAAWSAALKEVGATCGGCHTKYQAK